MTTREQRRPRSGSRYCRRRRRTCPRGRPSPVAGRSRRAERKKKVTGIADIVVRTVQMDPLPDCSNVAASG